MILQQEDKDEIIAITAIHYFTEQNWKWLNLKKDLSKLFTAFEEIKEQYDKYPYMDKNWYVENSATKSVHMSDNWDELQQLRDFLLCYHQYFHFMVRPIGGRKTFCITNRDGKLTNEQKNAAIIAEKIGYNAIVFVVSIPDSIEFDIIQVGGAKLKDEL